MYFTLNFKKHVGIVFQSAWPAGYFWSLWFHIASASAQIKLNQWFLYFWPFWSLFSVSWADQGLANIKCARNNRNVIYSCVINSFYFSLWSKSVGRSDPTYENWTFIIIFLPLCPVSPGCCAGPGADHAILKQMITVSFIIACLIIFIFNSDWIYREECSFFFQNVIFLSRIFDRCGLFLQNFEQVSV